MQMQTKTINSNILSHFQIVKHTMKIILNDNLHIRILSFGQLQSTSVSSFV